MKQTSVTASAERTEKQFMELQPSNTTKITFLSLPSMLKQGLPFAIGKPKYKNQPRPTWKKKKKSRPKNTPSAKEGKKKTTKN